MGQLQAGCQSTIWAEGERQLDALIAAEELRARLIEPNSQSGRGSVDPVSAADDETGAAVSASPDSAAPSVGQT